MTRRARSAAVAAVAVAAALARVPLVHAARGDVGTAVFAGPAAVAIFTHADGRVTAMAAHQLAPGQVRVVVRTCDADACVSESGARAGAVSPASHSSWRVDVVTSTLGRIRLTAVVSPGTFSSRGCSIRWNALHVDVASEGADLASARWSGTAGGRSVRPLHGLQCSLVHQAGFTTFRPVAR